MLIELGLAAYLASHAIDSEACCTWDDDLDYEDEYDESEEYDD